MRSVAYLRRRPPSDIQIMEGANAQLERHVTDTRREDDGKQQSGGKPAKRARTVIV